MRVGPQSQQLAQTPTNLTTADYLANHLALRVVSNVFYQKVKYSSHVDPEVHERRNLHSFQLCKDYFSLILIL